MLCISSKKSSVDYQVSNTQRVDWYVPCIKKEKFLWILLRKYSFNNPDIPEWGGYVSITGEKPKRKTIISCFPVIHQPITEYKTVQECPRKVEEATKELGHEYAMIMLHFGFCMKAYPLVWNGPFCYDKDILLIRTFHLICAFFHVIRKKIKGCGFSYTWGWVSHIWYCACCHVWSKLQQGYGVP